MTNRMKAVDQYIARSQPFAQPILEYIRELVHSVSPDVQEVIKWGFPHFEYKGNLCYMASFKKHCALGFWKQSIMKDEDKIINPEGKTAMGSFGRITSLKDLPSKKIMIKYIKEAIALNENGTNLPKKPTPASKTPIAIPDDLSNKLAKNKKAKSFFEQLSPFQKKEFVQWITEAKRADTRKRRMDATLEMLSENKTRNWNYK